MKTTDSTLPVVAVTPNRIVNNGSMNSPRSYNATVLFGSSPSNSNKESASGPMKNSSFLAAVKNKSDKGSYQIKIDVVICPPAPTDHFGAWKGRNLVCFDFYNERSDQTHFAFRNDRFAELFEMASQFADGLDPILTKVEAIPKRDPLDVTKEKTRTIKIPGGRMWSLTEYYLCFTIHQDRNKEQIIGSVYAILDAIAKPQTRVAYFESRQQSSEKVKTEIHPETGNMWNTLRSARTDTVYNEHKHLDDLTTLDKSCQLVCDMFQLSGTPDQWHDRRLASFASSQYDAASY